MRTRTRTHFSVRLTHRLLALAAAALLATTPALADPAALASTPSGDSGGASPAPSSSILDDVLGDGGMTLINYCPAPSGDPCDSSGPASIGNGSGANLGAGNPIHLASGHKYRRETDLPALPGVLGLEIVRHYNSTLANPDRPMGILGRGWRLSYETELAVFDTAIHILQADGSRVFFGRSGEDALKDTLIAHDPAYGQLRVRGAAARPEGFEWRWPDGRRLDFDARGRLLQIVAPDGHFVSLLRGPQGELLRVTDPQGRSLVFEYAPRNASGFRGVVAIGTPLGRFTLAHQNDRAAPGLSNLVAVTDPEGGVRRYHYGADEAEFAPHLPHHLTGISVEGEAGPVRIVTYGYDARGRATLSVRGVPRRTDEAGHTVPGTGIEQVSVDYVERGVTVVTNSLGERTTYRHAVINSGYRLIEAIGPGCASCGPTNRRYAYDTLGRMLEEIALGADGAPMSATVFEYDARGRILSRALRTYRDGAPGEARTMERYAYTGDSPRPTLVARPSVVPGKAHQVRVAYNEHGQILSVTESGFSPLDEAGAPAASPDAATPIERTTTFTYTSLNRRSLLAEIDGPLANGPTNDPSDSDITRFTWDTQGKRIERLTQPGKRASHIAYESATGLVARVENHEGFYTEFAYNARLQAVRIRSHGPGWDHAQALEHRFDARGHLAETTSANDPARNMRFSFDAQGRLEWVANALGILETLEHDHESRLIGHRRLSASFEQSRFWRYDAAGRLEATGDNRGGYVQAQYDSRGRLATLRDASGLAHRSAATSNGASNHAETTLGVVRLFDDFGNLVWNSSPDTGVQHRHFDAAGRLVAMRDAMGHHARYEYDVRDRIQRQTVTDALHGHETVTTWGYEGDRLVELDHPTQHERYTYDARGLRVARIVTSPTEAGELTAITRYENDATGRLVATTLPDGSTLRYQRNGQAQVVSVTRSTIRTAWLRRFEREQTIASEFERDMFGLRSFTTGNGIQTRFERSREGALARTVHRHLPQSAGRIVAETYPSIVLGRDVFGVFERIVGITPAHATPAENGSNGARTGAAPVHSELPGALGLPVEPGTLLDRRYLWDTRGNLLHSRQPSATPMTGASMDTHAYDAHGQLVASVRWTQHDDTAHEQSVWRYAYGASQRRVLAQQGVPTQLELSAHTTRSRFEPDTHRRIGTDDTRNRYNANGQPLELEGRSYAWDALGRLVAVHEAGHTLARYGYDHRGLRNRKTLNGDSRYTLHDEARQALAELDADGRILRQYVWLADLPIAVIDFAEGVAPAAPEQTTLGRITNDLRRIVKGWFGETESLVWLHTNHLGAPELATARDGDIVWQAHYSPFGAATVQQQGFELDLRLPGQRFDIETGLHYNRQRYYDPEHGQYLTPDPLGTPDGPNPYVYVAFNPLIYVDPDGLILFAFDGTGNDKTTQQELSNVVNFEGLYLDSGRYYISGVGTVDTSDPTRPIDPADFRPWYVPLRANTADMGGNYSGPARIDRMIEYFNIHATDVALDDSVAMDVDIIGFSRGAAQARDFANRIVANTTNGWYRYVVEGQTHCQMVNLRFLGLWDTVLSTNLSGYAYNLAIPDEFAYVAQAVALNEYRGGVVAFPAESILRAPAPQGATRIERAFLGSHSDIGGGFPDGDLAKVALVWMVDQATAAGVQMQTLTPSDRTIITNPVIHDKSSNLFAGAPTGGPTAWSEDRDVRYADGSVVRQRQTVDQGMTYADTVSFISYTPNPNAADNISGAVDMQDYLNWLNKNGYDINMTVQ